ncbi:MAG: threonine synthase [Chloroflexi bacterium]|nr:threonine synthase [Chloroflexota bacterium]
MFRQLFGRQVFGRTRTATDWPGVLTRYPDLIDVPAQARAITLLEGNTPLIPAVTLSEELGCKLWIKYEGLNPTGSFKDRGMTAAVTQAVYSGAETIMCASTGNTAASAAAYAARAGIRCVVIVPEGKVAQGKLAGALAYGAEVVSISGSFDDGLTLVREATEKLPIALVNSINPYRLEGQTSAAYEIVDVLGSAPDWLCLPVGNAGNISAYWMGFKRYWEAGRTERLPRLLGTQAEGAAPLVKGYVIKQPETVATAIRIGSPARGEQALAAADESGGFITAVSDAAILSAWRQLATQEGIFVEPASAAGLAGLLASVEQNRIDVKGQRVVCVVTGHGLKDPQIVLDQAEPPATLEPTMAALEDYLA